MMLTGVWCTRPTLADIRLAYEIGFRRLDVMVHDMSKQSTPTNFSMEWPRERYIEATKRALDAGFDEVHFTAWAMPHVVYMAYAGDTLQQLCLDAGAHGIVLDAEEPWTKAKLPDYDKAAEAFFEQAKACRVGITGIGYCNTDKLGPLMASADYGMPQCYATNTSDVPPENLLAIVGYWRLAWDKPLIPGLAAYRQSGIAGHTTRSAMRTARGRVGEFDTVVYWALRHIKGNALIRETLRRMLADQRAARAGAA